MNNQETHSNDTFLGIQLKVWAKIILHSIFWIVLIFIVVPFLLSVFLPILNPNFKKEYGYLVDMLDGVSIVLALFSTVASGFSIIMTFIDKKRYSEEKNQTLRLFSSVEDMQAEIKIVDTYVQKTFEQNQKLALELFNNKVIQVFGTFSNDLCA